MISDNARSNDLFVLTKRRAGYTCIALNTFNPSVLKGMQNQNDKPTVDKVDAAKTRLIRQLLAKTKDLKELINAQGEYITTLENHLGI